MEAHSHGCKSRGGVNFSESFVIVFGSIIVFAAAGLIYNDPIVQTWYSGKIILSIILFSSEF